MGGGGHKSIACELTAENAENLVKTAVGLAGPLSGLVHSAGAELTRPFRNTSLDDLKKVMSINFDVFWVLAQEFVRRGNHDPASASVVGIGSAAGVYGAKGRSAYAASKGALVSLVRTLASEYAPKNIRFNCVSPGLVNTPLLDSMRALYGEEERFKAEVLSKQPLGLGAPEDVAGAVCWLLSPSAKWVTGSVFDIDGGYGIR